MTARPRIDWNEVKGRLAASQAALVRESLRVDSARLEQVYAERAAQLANYSTASASVTDAWPALMFTLGTERLCLELGALSEVLPYARCSPLPGARPELLGVINVRGRICSVLDLARILGQAEHGDRASAYIILARHRGIEIGLRVDDVDRIAAVTSAELDELAGDLAALNTRYIRGCAADRVAVLDLEAVCSHFVFNPEATAGAEVPSGSGCTRQADRDEADLFSRTLFGVPTI
jgi:purine-binding chemotaxis protein CheW